MPIPVPSAAINVPISAEPSILSKRARSTLRILPFKGRIAWKRRSRPCFAEPPALSPSTMKSSHFAGSRSWQSASFPGRLAMSSAPLRLARRRPLDPLADDAPRIAGMLLEPLLQLVGDDALDHGAHLGGDEL